jgi:phosphoglucomutase
MDLLAAEITAVMGMSPARLYRDLTAQLGEPLYERIDALATRPQKAVLQKLSPDQVKSRELAGEPITAMLTTAPGNKAAIGGLKVITANGWFAARPSGTEDVYKLYAESFNGRAHLRRIQDDAQALIREVFAAAGV